jgi:MoxR-like ATPase
MSDSEAKNIDFKEESSLHPLEESVLSIASGRFDKSEKESSKKGVFKATEIIEDNSRVYETLQDTSFQKLASISELINESIRFISENVLGRDEVIRQSFYALITGEHQIIVSRTGMAKSLLARQIFSCFDDAHLFEKQLTKDTMPENLFGAYDMESMKKGKMIHNVEGSLVLSHFAFLDEIFDANDMLLRSLLSLLNEKQLVNGEQIVNSTLHTAIATANYVRITEIMEAVLDRFLYKSYLPENRGLFFQYSIDHVYQNHFGKVAIPENRLTLGQLSFVKNVVRSRQIDMPWYLLFLKNHIINKYVEETRKVVSDRQDYTVSDRKRVKILDMLRASAVLDGRHQVEDKDLDNLHYVVCTLGRDEEKNRLHKITSAARNYFRQDKKVLENVFDAISILNIIKTSENREMLRSDATFNNIKNRLEKVSRSENSIFKEYINRIKQTFMTQSRENYIFETFRILEDISELSLKNTITREGKELITGFRTELSRAKKINY